MAAIITYREDGREHSIDTDNVADWDYDEGRRVLIVRTLYPRDRPREHRLHSDDAEAAVRSLEREVVAFDFLVIRAEQVAAIIRRRSGYR